MSNIQKSVKSIVPRQTMFEKCVGFTLRCCSFGELFDSAHHLHLTLDIHRHPTFKVWDLEETRSSNSTEALLGKMAKKGKRTHLFLQTGNASNWWIGHGNTENSTLCSGSSGQHLPKATHRKQHNCCEPLHSLCVHASTILNRQKLLNHRIGRENPWNKWNMYSWSTQHCTSRVTSFGFWVLENSRQVEASVTWCSHASRLSRHGWTHGMLSSIFKWLNAAYSPPIRANSGTTSQFSGASLSTKGQGHSVFL